jgi:hypothetical protein
MMAQSILIHLFARLDFRGDDTASMMAGRPDGEQALQLVRQRQQLLRDAWLTEVGHRRPGLNRGLPLPEAETKAEADAKASVETEAAE